MYSGTVVQWHSGTVYTTSCVLRFAIVRFCCGCGTVFARKGIALRVYGSGHVVVFRYTL